MLLHILLGNWFLTFWTETEKSQAVGLMEGEIGSRHISFTTKGTNGKERRADELVWWADWPAATRTAGQRREQENQSEKMCRLTYRQFNSWRKEGRGKTSEANNTTHDLPQTYLCPTSLWTTATSEENKQTKKHKQKIKEHRTKNPSTLLLFLWCSLYSWAWSYTARSIALGSLGSLSRPCFLTASCAPSAFGLKSPWLGVNMLGSNHNISGVSTFSH